MSNVVLTKDQVEANNKFLDFLVSEENFFVIQGHAGTGKSFLIKHLLETFYSKYKAYCLLLQEDVKTFDIKITATTNKAVNVVQDFLQELLDTRKNLEVKTIYSLLGLRVVNNNKTGKTELSYTKGGGTNFGGNGTPLIFVDEASFIGENLHEIIEQVLKVEANAKIVYIGDKYQLTTPGQTFCVMDDLKYSKTILDQIVRNSGHILTTGVQFRTTVETGIFKPIHYNGTDIIHANGPEFQRLVEKSFSDPHWTPATSKVLAWTNETVQGYNAHIRKALNRPVMFEVGEIVITNEFIKGCTGYSRPVDSEVLITNIETNTYTNGGVDGYMVELNGMYVGFMPKRFSDAKALMKDIAFRAKTDNTLWKKYFEIKENWLDLRAVYASTVNKAQGSSYETVFLNLTDVGKNWDANGAARLLYVAITRASKQVVCYGHLPDKYC